ncbi:pilus assembly protein CpaF [Bifidobacterium commune]|uniref:Pilus assembly protein CpaF n=1 Tax=Bifidobacterium commune TaxID=1505727 RepID=A0A1C4GZ89_9BIFI|nr:ATPase, T2SS/T4P/T4SS family [Bifidobacterium commune]MBB2955317.1 pilus assembly protein CpaF [Bifidobacterium commune]SCC77955.1 pilus assembly protein CpaF [Bifidobacterium commune]
MFGPLEELSHQSGLTDIAVTCEGRVWIDCGRGMAEYHPAVPFRSPQVVREYATQLCAQLGKRLDDACPIADASSVEGIRVHAVIAPLVPTGASISIRFPSLVMPCLADLGTQGLFPAPWFPLLCALVSRHATILITGNTGAGKTTLLKALLSQADPTERVVSVEEVRELGMLGRGNHVALVAREANVEGAGAIGLPDLVKATLRMRPDRIILGECRGEEIADLLRAFNSGHHGGMATLHADGVDRVPSRLVSLGLLAGLNREALTMLAAGAFDVVLHLERRHGKRRIVEIGRLTADPEHFSGESVATWDGTGLPVPAPAWVPFVSRWME